LALHAYFRAAVIAAAVILAPLVRGETLVAEVELSGKTPNPDTGSSGSGYAKVELDTVQRSIKISSEFADLVNPLTSAKLHCCAALGAGDAAPATATIDGFPIGAQRGATDFNKEKHDVSLTSFWDPNFLAANGGVAGAIAALGQALKEGKVYLQLSTNADNFPRGEVRGYLRHTMLEVQFSRLFGNELRANLVGEYDLHCTGYSERCIVPVYAQMDGKLRCVSRIDFNHVKVPAFKDYNTGHVDATKKVRVVWVLVNGMLGDANHYRFSPTSGIVMGDKSTMGVTLDPSKDFNGSGDDSRDNRRYKWVSVRKRTGDNFVFPYLANVDRYDPEDDQWKPCRPIDPTISNR
jgi:hypothetical protein